MKANSCAPELREIKTAVEAIERWFEKDRRGLTITEHGQYVVLAEITRLEILLRDLKIEVSSLEEVYEEDRDEDDDPDA